MIRVLMKILLLFPHKAKGNQISCVDSIFLQTVTPIEHEIFGYNWDELEFIPEDKLEEYRLEFKNGLAYLKGKPLSTGSIWNREKTAIFIMDMMGNIYVSKWKRNGYFHHISFGIEEVAAAGEIAVKKGQIIMLNNNSGHYEPPPWTLDQVLQTLSLNSVNLDFITVVKIEQQNRARTFKEYMESIDFRRREIEKRFDRNNTFD